MERLPIGNKSLAQACANALYGTGVDEAEVAKRKTILKNHLEHLKTLVDEGKLGCIITVKLLSLDGSQVEMQPIGDPRLILQAATQLVRQSVKQASPEPAPSESDPSQH